MRNLVSALCIALFATSCNILPKREPTRVFVPTHAASQAATQVTGPSVSWSLLVAKPATSDWLDSERISVRPGAGNVQVYKGARWSDPVPELVQSALLHGFEDSHKI
ncbi:MAG: ABC-type transport auxiliary lipoprotein family protein, partial [Pseudoxanthomonas sp.]